MKKLLIFCTLSLVISSSYGMKKFLGDDNSGTMSLSANARSICDGIDNVLVSSGPLNSTLFVIGWHNANSSRYGLFDSESLKNPHVASAIVAGVIGSAVHAIVKEESLNKTSPLIRPIVKVAAKHPFLVAYTGLHAWYRWHEIKNNPWPFVAETSLIALHLYNESNY